MALKHHNHEYDGGSPDVPLAVGDRFYSQDLGRDFNYLRDLAGKVLIDVAKGQPVLISAGLITKGAGDTLNIPAAVGYVKFSVKVPSSPAVPPTVATEDALVRVESTAQSNMALPSATLDGVTLNYIKLAYVEKNEGSRTRAKKVGSYYYEQSPSFTITASPAAPTAYQVQLGTLIGTSGGSFAITSAAPWGEVRYDLDGAVSAGDLLMLTETGKVRKYFRQGASQATPVTGNFATWDVARIDDERFVLAYSTGSPSRTLYLVIGRHNGDGTFTWGTPTSSFVTSSALTPQLAMLSATQGLLVYGVSGTGVSGVGFTVSASPSLSFASVGSPVSIFSGATTSSLTPRLRPIDSGRALVVFETTGPIHYANNLAVSGTTVTPSTNTNFSAVAVPNSPVVMEVFDHSALAIAAVAIAVLASSTLYLYRLSCNGAAAPVLDNSNSLVIPALTGTAQQSGFLIRKVRSGDTPGMVVLTEHHQATTGYLTMAHHLFPGFSVAFIDSIKRSPLPIMSGTGAVASFLNFGANADPPDEDVFLWIATTSDNSDGTTHRFAVFGQLSMPLRFENHAGWSPVYVSAVMSRLNNRRFILGTSAGTEELWLVNSPTTIVGIAKDSNGGIVSSGGRLSTSGLLPGRTYYAQPDGSFGLTRSLMRVGKALSATDLLVDLGVETE